MSKRARIDKRANRLRKALRNTPPASIDVVQYVMDHHRLENRRRPTRAQAVEMVLAGKVTVGSHKVGRYEVDLLGHKEWVLDPHIPAHQRSEIVITP